MNSYSIWKETQPLKCHIRKSHQLLITTDLWEEPQYRPHILDVLFLDYMHSCMGTFYSYLKYFTNKNTKHAADKFKYSLETLIA